jgi:lipopolysaccharide export system protein LptA
MKSSLLRFFLFSVSILGASGASLLCAADAAEEAMRTVIDSETLEMQGTEDRNFFYFRGNVHVTGTNLEIRCDELTVTAFRGGEEDETVGEIGAIEAIVAKGNVEITQAGRVATAGRVEVDPVAGTVSLLDDPKMVDGEVEVEGYKFVFYKDDRRVEVVADPYATPDKPARSRVSLGALPANAFEQEEEAVTVTDRLNSESATAEEPVEEDETSPEETDGNE